MVIFSRHKNSQDPCSINSFHITFLQVRTHNHKQPGFHSQIQKTAPTKSHHIYADVEIVRQPFSAADRKFLTVQKGFKPGFTKKFQNGNYFGGIWIWNLDRNTIHYLRVCIYVGKITWVDTNLHGLKMLIIVLTERKRRDKKGKFYTLSCPTVPMFYAQPTLSVFK